MNSPVPSTITRLWAGPNRIVKLVCAVPGTSQYTTSSVSSCALAALNAVRVVFDVERDYRGAQLLAKLQRPEVTRACLAICNSWKRSAHLDVDELHSLPLFQATLLLAWKKVSGTAGGKPFTRILQALIKESDKRGSSCSAVITRPPEVITIFCVPVPMDSDPASTVYIFAVFDSHPRPIHPDGAAFILLRDIDAATEYLDEILTIDQDLFQDPSLQWQAELLSQFSAHCFVPKTDINFNMTAHAYELNVSWMDLRQQLAEAETKVAAAENWRAIASRSRRPQTHEVASRNHISPSPSTPSDWRTTLLSPSQRAKVELAESSGSQSRRAEPAFEILSPQLSLLELSARSSSSQPGSRRSPSSDHLSAASLSVPSSPKATTTNPPLDTGREHHVIEDDFALAARLAAEDQNDLNFARAAQQEFDRENERLRSERGRLEAFVPQTFDCAVCMETFAQDHVSLVEDCSHVLCRQCMRQYIVSALRDKKFPIPCPLCQAAASGKSSREPTALHPHIIETIGLSPDQYEVWVSLQLAGVSVEIECRKCKFKAHVDRQDHDQTHFIACQSRNCRYVWCRMCNQEIPHGRVNHSCDGTKELDALMGKSGWKYCPGCKTPCEKIMGCQHMKCPAPNCNTHFCYKCGESIVKSMVKREIDARVSQHYRKCTMF
ncbi:hypothetical protein BKA62DRAFT_386156 [Auriculariales sp. MPI-PUGE-AT-0066]|nr:hypothetical protein BKA62DRAFT_386156 [Auriculariales sp. MPI-PUGE-AT-0066]